ncbi:glycoside hydrolase [Paenibacillus sp. FSL H8-0548]|uniref:DUF5054 domain-containing protein n=1 Tax=Paenibacillus sp. FSL H8-0548 TaxID=1920422 RepID=UPI00096F03D5|nr:DUF5054 domain-containing protein [Paenibacillus sp. FSL H8-0548]OMF34564.1 glycoside hydrolase [Paenibacillus sp. FSL H8-0548]
MSISNDANDRIETVHVVFKTHLDIGFTDLAARVIERYRCDFIPKAIALAEKLAERNGAERFIWTTGSWLIHYVLRYGTSEEAERLRKAIEAGHIAWHGLPFTTHTELMDASLFRYGLSLSSTMDASFGKKTIAAKMTDVPGHTIAMVPLMAQAGLRYLHLGVNPASKVPSVPKLFRWMNEQDGSELIVNYASNYGEDLVLEGMNDVLVFAHTGDNCGPPSAEEIVRQFAALAAKYPNAEIKASTLDAFAEKLLPHREQLPIVCEEIGDTWIHGAGTDPFKVSRYRELLRLKDKWLQEGKWSEESEEYKSFCESLLLVPEHTWGMDEKKHLCDFRNYSKSDFQSAREVDLIAENAVPAKYSYIGAFAMDEADRLSEGLFQEEASARSYSRFASSWDEQRNYVNGAIEALSEPKREEALFSLKSLSYTTQIPSDAQWLAANTNYKLGVFEIAFGLDGSIRHLKDKGGKRWADQDYPIGLYAYETFGPANYEHWFASYSENLVVTHPWADADFGKPGIELLDPRPSNLIYIGEVVNIRYHSLNVEDVVYVVLAMPEEATECFGAPRTIQLEYRFDKHKPTINLVLSWSNKDANRLPEASWLSFVPRLDNASRWRLDKMGQLVNPLDVVKDGNRYLHAVNRGITYQGADGSLAIDTLDAALVAPGARRLLRFDNVFVPLDGGMHFNLHNNVWGTNFPMWYGDDASFRFKLDFNADGS